MSCRDPTVVKRMKRRDPDILPPLQPLDLPGAPQARILGDPRRPLTGTPLGRRRSPTTGTRTVLEARRPHTTGDPYSPRLLSLLQPDCTPRRNDPLPLLSRHELPLALRTDPAAGLSKPRGAPRGDGDPELLCSHSTSCPSLAAQATGIPLPGSPPSPLTEPRGPHHPAPVRCLSPIQKQRPCVAAPQPLVDAASPSRPGSAASRPAPPPSPAQISPATRVRLNHQRVLGRGAWGVVYVGLNEATRELIAVKEVTFTSCEEVERCAREIRVMKALDHPNIVKYLGAERAGNTLKIYMDYIVGGSLAGLIKNFGELTEVMAQGYCIQVLEGLVYLHDKNIAHRDIKCDNLLVEKNGDVKLADFGQSKDAGELLKTMTGTANFMAPEVIKGEGYTLLADIWSFGCAVIEMLTGRAPFSQYENPWAAMYHVMNTDPETVIPKTCSAVAQDFLRCCLQRVPSARWPAQRLLSHPFLAGRLGESIDAIRQSVTTLHHYFSQIDPFGSELSSPLDTPSEGSPSTLLSPTSFRGPDGRVDPPAPLPSGMHLHKVLEDGCHVHVSNPAASRHRKSLQLDQQALGSGPATPTSSDSAAQGRSRMADGGIPDYGDGAPQTPPNQGTTSKRSPEQEKRRSAGITPQLVDLEQYLGSPGSVLPMIINRQVSDPDPNMRRTKSATPSGVSRPRFSPGNMQGNVRALGALRLGSDHDSPIISDTSRSGSNDDLPRLSSKPAGSAPQSPARDVYVGRLRPRDVSPPPPAVEDEVEHHNSMQSYAAESGPMAAVLPLRKTDV